MLVSVWHRIPNFSQPRIQPKTVAKRAVPSASKLTKIAICAAGLGLSAAAASAVTVSDTQIMVSNGQDFTFEFGGLGSSDGTGGTLIISNGQSLTNPGPYDGLDIDSQGNSNEFFEVLVEGVSLGTYNCRGNNGHTFITGCTGSVDSQFTLSLAVTPMLLTNALSDGIISVVLAFSNTVNHLSDRDEVNLSLEYQGVTSVPLPLSSLLLTTGLLGLWGTGRKA